MAPYYQPQPPPTLLTRVSSSQVYFNISEFEQNQDFSKLWEDYRPLVNQSNPEERWKLCIISNENVTFTWDTSGVPPEINLTMKIGDVTIDMKQQSSYTLGAGEHVVEITAKYVSQDTTPPKIYNLHPIGEVFAQEIPIEVTISANYSDNVGIDISSVKMLVNNEDVTDKAIVTESGISYTFLAGEGTYTVYLEVSDLAGNKANATWSFSVIYIPKLDVTVKPDVIVVNTPTEVKITVTSDGKPVEGATVIVSGCGVSLSDVTDVNGQVKMTILPKSVGTINVSAIKEGYRSGSAKIIVVPPVQEWEVNLTIVFPDLNETLTFFAFSNSTISNSCCSGVEGSNNFSKRFLSSRT